MKITAVRIDGFGVWSGLQLQGLSDGLNVLHGPNEAGKSTLLQFIRSVLYGFSPRARRYFPPVHGGTPGGWIELAGTQGRFQVVRQLDANATDAPEALTVTAADGTRHGEHIVKLLLCNVDETTYANVFAVGLREIQEIGTLNDTDAAESLYQLTAGLDRISLLGVMQELHRSRKHILEPDGGACQIAQLLEQRAKLYREIEDLGQGQRRYGRLASEREQLEREIAALEEENADIERRARVVELAVALRDRWSRRAELDEELAAIGPGVKVPQGAPRRLDALKARLAKHQQRLVRIRDQREAIHAEAKQLPLNAALARQAARIEAFEEQQAWMTTLGKQVEELEAEIEQLELGQVALHEELGLPEGLTPDLLTALPRQAIRRFRPPIKALGRARRELVAARQARDDARRKAETLQQEIATALAARGESNVSEAMDRVGHRVSQLRRRVQLDQRLEEMARYETELEQQSRDLLGRQMMPAWMLVGLGAVFVFGVLLLMAGLFMPTSITGSMGWAMALLGLAGSGAAALGKVASDRSSARQLDSCQKQLSMVRGQSLQMHQERDTLDGQLASVGSPEQALEAAENELAELEELVPLETRRQSAEQETLAATDRVRREEEQYKETRRQWRDTLRLAGLPADLPPKTLAGVIRQYDSIRQTQQRLQQCGEVLAQRQRELEGLLGRLAQVVDETGVGDREADPLDQLRVLRAALDEQQRHEARRETLRRQSRQLRRKGAKHKAAAERMKQHRRKLLHALGAKDEDDFRQRVVQAERAEALRRDRDALAADLAAAIDRTCSEEMIRQQIHSGTPEQLQSRRDALLERLEALDGQLQQRFEARGRLAEQLRVIVDDKQMAARRLEVKLLEKRLDDAVRRWQVLAVTGHTLQAVRDEYEQHRQPETLRDASGYLESLTQGRYHRVWTPLGEDVLRVDDSEGNALPVEVLSRGTREQLFLALRLALVAAYARRGAPLPLVLDDVLVNFDAHRAKAAVDVLRDFAENGHQVLVFTCHEHILKLFKTAKAPVNRLPENSSGELAPICFAPTPAATNGRKSNSTSSRTKGGSPRKQRHVAPADAPEDDEDDFEDIVEESALDAVDDAEEAWEEVDEEEYDEDDSAEAA